MVRAAISTLIGLFTNTDRTLEARIADNNRGLSHVMLWLVAWSNVPMMAVMGSREMVRTGMPAFSNLWVVMLILMPLLFYVSRAIFVFLVTMGLRIVASSQYPRDKEERKRHALLLRRMYPYHVSPIIISNLVWPLVNGTIPGTHTEMLTSMVLNVAYTIFSLGITIFTIVLMVKIVKRVYGVSTVQAFWGPIVAYLLFGLVFGLIVGIIALTAGIITAV